MRCSIGAAVFQPWQGEESWGVWKGEMRGSLPAGVWSTVPLLLEVDRWCLSIGGNQNRILQNMAKPCKSDVSPILQDISTESSCTNSFPPAVTKVCAFTSFSLSLCIYIYYTYHIIRSSFSYGTQWYVNCKGESPRTRSCCSAGCLV